MKFIAKAIIYGFAFNLGAALFKKVQRHLGLGDPTADKTAPEPVKPDGPNGSSLQHHYT
jgi:hypothetical protein